MANRGLALAFDVIVDDSFMVWHRAGIVLRRSHRSSIRSPEPRARELVLRVVGHLEQGTAMDARALFLARIKSDSGLQRLLQDPAIAETAMSIARAAGFVVTPAELTASDFPGRASSAEMSKGDALLASGAAEGDQIDFDGDGIADAVRRGDRWQLTAQDEG